MHKSTQAVVSEYIVEGPNEEGQYRVTGPFGTYANWMTPEQFQETINSEAVQLHIASLPMTPTPYGIYEAMSGAICHLALKVRWSLEEATDLTEAEAIELMALLEKVSK